MTETTFSKTLQLQAGAVLLVGAAGILFGLIGAAIDSRLALPVSAFGAATLGTYLAAIFLRTRQWDLAPYLQICSLKRYRSVFYIALLLPPTIGLGLGLAMNTVALPLEVGDHQIIVITGNALASVLMAIAEEFIFRVVVLIGLIRAGARVSLALVLQALLFTVFHQGGGIYAQVVIFTIAMALGFFVMHTKSVIPAMIAHATWNLTELTRSVLVGGDFLGVSAAPPTEFMDVIIPATVSLSMLTAAIVGYALDRSTAPRLSEAPVQQCEQLSNPNLANAAWRAW